MHVMPLRKDRELPVIPHDSSVSSSACGLEIIVGAKMSPHAIVPDPDVPLPVGLQAYARNAAPVVLSSAAVLRVAVGSVTEIRQ